MRRDKDVNRYDVLCFNISYVNRYTVTLRKKTHLDYANKTYQIMQTPVVPASSRSM